MMSALLHVVQGEYAKLVDDFVEMGCLDRNCDRESLCRDLIPILNARFSEGLSRVRFRKLLFDFSEVVYRYPFRLPVEFTYIMRALLMLEGIALTIDPGFQFLDVAVPFIQSLMQTRSGTLNFVMACIRAAASLTKTFTTGDIIPQPSTII